MSEHENWEAGKSGAELEETPGGTETTRPTEAERLALREELETNPTLWQRAGDLGALARRLALEKLPPVAREATMKLLAEMEGELEYAESPKVERLLIEQVLSCWLQVYLAEMVYAPTALSVPDAARAATIEKKLNGAQRRFMRALELLARVRRQLRPEVVQVNIGAQQVNMAGG